MLGAAGLYALEHNLDRLTTDHRNARLIAERLRTVPGIDADIATVQTNMVVFRTRPGVLDAPQWCARAGKGVLVAPFGQHTIRAATHLDVSEADSLRAAEVLATCFAPMEAR